MRAGHEPVPPSATPPSTGGSRQPTTSVKRLALQPPAGFVVPWHAPQRATSSGRMSRS